MKCPKIEYLGFKLPISNLRWSENENIESCSFYDMEGNFKTAFQPTENSIFNQGILYLNLNEVIKI